MASNKKWMDKRSWVDVDALVPGDVCKYVTRNKRGGQSNYVVQQVFLRRIEGQHTGVEKWLFRSKERLPNSNRYYYETFTYVQLMDLYSFEVIDHVDPDA